MKVITVILVALAATATAWAEFMPYEVVRAYPSDREAFTQGLYYDGETLVLGTGQYGASSIRLVDLASGETLRRQNLDRRFFGEGVARHGDLLYQLTWKAGLGIIYEPQTLQPVRSFRYAGEGWGLTSDGEVLIMSNGSNILRGRDPATFETKWELRVTLDGQPVRGLNELEFIKGRIFANVWRSDRIMVIDPQSGVVEGVLNLARVGREVRKRNRKAGVLNGIAYDARRDLVLVTGKNWHRIYALRLGERK